MSICLPLLPLPGRQLFLWEGFEETIVDRQSSGQGAKMSFRQDPAPHEPGDRFAVAGDQYLLAGLH